MNYFFPCGWNIKNFIYDEVTIQNINKNFQLETFFKIMKFSTIQFCIRFQLEIVMYNVIFDIMCKTIVPRISES